MTILFDPELYSEGAVQRAIRDYRSIASFTYTVHDNIQCSLIHSQYDEDLTALEFSNYVLSLSVSPKGGMQ